MHSTVTKSLLFGWNTVETKVLFESGERKIPKEQLDGMSRNRIEYEKMQWLTKDMAVPGCDRTKINNLILTQMYSSYSNVILAIAGYYKCRFLQNLFIF